MKLLENAKTLLSNPEVAWNYLTYWGSKLRNSGQAARVFPNGIKVTSLRGFSEFYIWKKPLLLEEKLFLEEYPIPTGALIDIGANLGFHSMILAKRFPDQQIYSFEPNPLTFQDLKENIKLNLFTNVQIEQTALCEQDGEVVFNAKPIDRGTSSIATSGSDSLIKARCLKLDTYTQSKFIEEIGFLKIDVEGYETLVIQGAKRLLSNQQIKLIYYEVCPDLTREAGFKPELPTQILRQHQYEIYKLNAQGSLVLARDSDISLVVWENWIAIPK